jgi:hypothetical protein
VLVDLLVVLVPRKGDGDNAADDDADDVDG